ncbi:TrkA family potassium uptake protein [Spirulina major CS-329]|jgi:trk system potassium uptake protein TrkA|uniref:potassium channel family protein n=1 Tax=Spirulina TaxID=1154 RepID=UPI00093466E3|nr:MULTISPECIES: TrkA family potassium uptake protein [Spirulina]MDB9493160.1 TrkA family potassium uptake protein [Spirulina subsalsa CS-330]MDB9502298.1 TrkA family potassium uptake protein [Spirulina major CS-329]
MNLRSLKFLSSLRKDNRQFAVIGLGRFGRAVAASLYGMGYEVLGTDIDERLVASALNEQIATHTVRLDSTEPTALKEAGIYEFDTVVVAIGNYVQESIITTLNVKEGGVSHVVAKASSQIHGKLLERVGADQVVFPEYEAGCSLAYTLTKPAILDRFDLDPHHSIVEVLVPEEFDGKTIAEIQLRGHYGLTLLAVAEDDDTFEINPLPNVRLRKGTAMVVLGSNKDLKKLPI